MNLCVDQGNSSLKLGLFKDDVLISSQVYYSVDEAIISNWLTDHPIKNVIVSSVANPNQEIGVLFRDADVHFVELTHLTPLPFVNGYATPETLGKDRLAAVAGASWLMPSADILVIDAGTAITYDFIDANGYYHGGNIAPGIELRTKSLHHFTSRLPYVEPKHELLMKEIPLLGNDTGSAILSGVLYGAVFEIDGYIDRLLLKYPKLSVFLTGGSSIYFVNKLKSRTFADSNLVLIGLNRILRYNVK